MPATRCPTDGLARPIRGLTRRTKSLVRAAAIFWTSALAVTAVAEQAPAVRVVSEGVYSSGGAQQFLLHSQRLGRDFLVVVTPPPTASVLDESLPSHQRSADRKYPAIYALDAGYGIAGPLAQMMAQTQIMSPAYVISIGYPPGRADSRNTDLLHRAFIDDGRTYGGGGAIFQKFLTQDLRPFFESRYPLDPERAVLFGHSFGGLFTANVLATSPEAFWGYIIGSPSVWADPQLLPDLAAAASKGNGRRVYVAAGERETEDLGGKRAPTVVQGVDEIAAILAAPHSTFKVEKRIYSGGTHISYFPVLHDGDGMKPRRATESHGRIGNAPERLLEPISISGQISALRSFGRPRAICVRNSAARGALRGKVGQLTRAKSEGSDWWLSPAGGVH